MTFTIRKVEEKKKEKDLKGVSKRYIVIDLDGRFGIFDTIKYKIVASCIEEKVANHVCENWNK